jgi:hypothetical protein
VKVKVKPEINLKSDNSILQKARSQLLTTISCVCKGINIFYLFCVVSSCGGVLHGPSGTLKSPNYPNLYGSDQYCRWKISVPVNKKVLIRFKSLDTEYKNDYVIVSDPKTQTLITVLSGINRKEMLFASSSNEMEIKFISDNDRESIGFEATYEQVCKYQHCFRG